MQNPAEPAPSSDQKQQLILQANAAAARGDHALAWRHLRELPLHSFGELLLHIPEFHAALRQWLPGMASAEVQCNWTGSSGLPLLRQSVDFVQSMNQASEQFLGHGIQGRVLDYGCGWGRLLRLLLKYADPAQLYGTDPWQTSIDLCREQRVLAQLALCDYVPRALPFAESFDLIYAFSVFTHLSEKTATAVMHTLRRQTLPDGMLVITIRPPGYWDVHQGWNPGYSRESLLEQHHKQGFAFMPHNRAPIDGDITYGDASITLDYIARHWSDWRVLGTDHNPSDPWQIIVYLQPA
jgi:SAM-dependent methyltransferase